jgi:hypothetical protein
VGLEDVAVHAAIETDLEYVRRGEERPQKVRAKEALAQDEDVEAEAGALIHSNLEEGHVAFSAKVDALQIKGKDPAICKEPAAHHSSQLPGLHQYHSLKGCDLEYIVLHAAGCLLLPAFRPAVGGRALQAVVAPPFVLCVLVGGLWGAVPVHGEGVGHAEDYDEQQQEAERYAQQAPPHISVLCCSRFGLLPCAAALELVLQRLPVIITWLVHHCYWWDIYPQAYIYESAYQGYSQY